MNRPDLYSESNCMTLIDVADVLKKYSHLIRWKTDNEQNVLDIGCGDGRVTEELLYPRFENLQKLVAVDVSSEMIEFAKVYHSKEKLSYKQLDITTKKLDVDLKDKFDYIFSFFCFNWIQDQRQCASNLYHMLKPGGDVFLLFLIKTTLYQVYEKISTHQVWGAYMKDFKEYIPPYYFSKHPEKEYRDLLCQVGFDVNLCEIIDRSFTFEDIIAWKKYAISLNPFLGKMTDDMKEPYVESLLNVFRTFNCIVLKNNNNEETVRVQYKLLMVHANKPM